ncbi:MAG: hypothetical protein FJ405_11385 [Verrucomicrobia bacterium]|nr:hypothetical protein [Verrucomicrobiota bacterium]
MPPAKAFFLGEDRVTQGRWKGEYGRTGFHIPVLPPQIPWPIQAGPVDEYTFLWEVPVSDPRGVQHPDELWNLASCWVDTEKVTYRSAFLDGRPGMFSIYCLDWDSFIRISRIEIKDAETGKLLDERWLQEFRNGVWMSWYIQGDVILELTSLQGNGVISGAFFDPDTVIKPLIHSIVPQFLDGKIVVTLTWRSVPGRVCRIQVSEDLSVASWRNLGEPIVPEVFESKLTLELSDNPARLFFRIVDDLP